LAACGAGEPPPEDERACGHVVTATDALERHDPAAMVDNMRRAHEAAGTEHLHERTKMVVKVFNVSGEIYEAGVSDVRRHCAI
jgi:hypothetical protein